MTFEDKMKFLAVMSNKNYAKVMSLCNEQDLAPYTMLNKIIQEWAVYRQAGTEDEDRSIVLYDALAAKADRIDEQVKKLKSEIEQALL